MASPQTKWRDNKQSAAARGYGYRWRRARAGFLAKHPLCVMCKAEDKLTPADVVDHIVPHRGDKNLFWDSNNWQSLCYHHHNSSKQIEESADPRKEVNNEGFPTHPDHPWNDPRWTE